MAIEKQMNKESFIHNTNEIIFDWKFDDLFKSEVWCMEIIFVYTFAFCLRDTAHTNESRFNVPMPSVLCCAYAACSWSINLRPCELWRAINYYVINCTSIDQFKSFFMIWCSVYTVSMFVKMKTIQNSIAGENVLAQLKQSVQIKSWSWIRTPHIECDILYLNEHELHLCCIL